MTSETFNKVTAQEDRRNAPISSHAVGGPIRFVPKAHILQQSQSVATTPTARARSSTISSVSPSSASPPTRTSDEDKNIVEKSSASEPNLGSTNIEGKTADNALPTARAESTAMMVATSTSITPDKEIDKKACFDRTYAEDGSSQK